MNFKPSDFIILAEFCQDDGAKPIAKIPNTIDDFDSISFCRRVLASDHTKKIDGTSFFTEWCHYDDSQAFVQHDSYYCFVYYLTLHDTEARGYSRPFCISYLTKEPTKIMENFDLLTKSFYKVSMSIKYGNNLKFISDIKDKIQNLIKKEDEYFKKEGLEECYNELENLIKNFLSYDQKFVSIIFHLLFLEGDY